MSGSERNTIERAFELAKSGSCNDIEDIRRQLRREKYSNIDAHLVGMSIRKQLSGLMVAAGDSCPANASLDRDEAGSG